jgi:phage terminase large subunit
LPTAAGAGKTVAAINDIIRAAIMYQGPNGLFAYVAPYANQARRIAWDYFKFYAKPLIVDANEQQMTLTLVNGVKISLFGADNADGQIRGLGLSGVYMDEYGDFKPSVFGNVIRPALSDKQGWAVFAGTPKGKNQFWDIYETARRIPDEWFVLRLPASESGLLPQSELNAARAQLSEDQYLQEYECSFEAAILGAFYGTEMRQAEPRINERVVFTEGYPVHTAWDLGYRDDTAIWWYQVVGGEVRVIDFFAVSGADIRAIAEVVVNKGYTYGKHYLPHDARAKSLQTGRSIVEQLADHLGIGSLSVVPNIGLQDGIQAVRQMLPRTWFNSVRCGDGIEALRQYQREYDEDKKAFRASPRHDWTSHPADAFRMLAVAWRQEPAAQKPLESKVLIVGPQNEVTLNDMWQVHDRSVSRRARI